jgi:hypothetical protein
MRRFQGRDLSLGTGAERNAPESLTPIRSRRETATCSVDSHAGSLDQVGLCCRKVCASADLLTAGVESEAGKSQAKSCSVIVSRTRCSAELLRSGAPQGRDRHERRCLLRSRFCEASRREERRAASRPGHEAHCVFATRGGVAWVTNWVASSTPMPSGVGIIMRNGTRMRVPAIGANQASMLRCAARYLIAARSGM